MKTPGHFLNSFYRAFKNNRSSLSKRAFAKYLTIDASRLNEFMSDVRVPSAKMAEKIATRMNLEIAIKNQFLKSVEEQRARKKKKKLSIKLSLAEFNQISDWYYFAILSLADTLDFHSDPEWIATRLNISLAQAKKALQQLEEVGLLENKNGNYSLTHADVETESEMPSESLQKSHRQSLQRVIDNMSSVELHEREIQSVTFAGDPQKLRLAKKMIFHMTEKIVAALESGARREVYEINVQLFPLTRSNSK